MGHEAEKRTGPNRHSRLRLTFTAPRAVRRLGKSLLRGRTVEIMSVAIQEMGREEQRQNQMGRLAHKGWRL